MAKHLERVGSKQLFSFDITVHSVSLALSRPVKLNIVWKRRNKRTELAYKPALAPSVGSAEVEQTISMMNTLYRGSSGQFQEKKAVLLVQGILEDNQVKKLGKLTLDLARYIESPVKNREFLIENAPSTKAKLALSISGTVHSSETDAKSVSDFSGLSVSSEGSDRHLPEQKPPRALKRVTEEDNRLEQKIIEIKAKLRLVTSENHRLTGNREELLTEIAWLKERSLREKKNPNESHGNSQERIQELQQENSELSEKVVSVEGNCIGLKTKNSALQKNLAHLQKKQDELQKDLGQLRQAEMKLKQDLEKSVYRIEKVNRHKEKNKEKLMTMISYYNNQKAEIAQLTQRNQQLLSKFSNKNSVNVSETISNPYTVNEYRQALAQSNTEKEELSAVKKQLVKETNESKLALSRLEAQFEAVVSDKDAQILQLQSELLSVSSLMEQQVSKKDLDQIKLQEGKNEYKKKYSQVTQEYMKFKRDSVRPVLEESPEPSAYLTPLKLRINSLDQTLREREIFIQELTEENKALQRKLTADHLELTKLRNTEFSGSANVYLQGQVNQLQEQLDSHEKCHSHETLKLKQTNYMLDKEIEILKRALDETKDIYEHKVASIAAHNKIIKKEFRDSSLSQGDSGKVTYLEIEIKDLKAKLSKLVADNRELERNQIDAKLAFANSEIERESLAHRVRELNAELDETKEEYTRLDQEFHRVNERLGGVLNSNNDLEQEIFQLRKGGKSKR